MAGEVTWACFHLHLSILRLKAQSLITQSCPSAPTSPVGAVQPCSGSSAALLEEQLQIFTGFDFTVTASTFCSSLLKLHQSCRLSHLTNYKHPSYLCIALRSDVICDHLGKLVKQPFPIHWKTFRVSPIEKTWFGCPLQSGNMCLILCYCFCFW